MLYIVVILLEIHKKSRLVLSKEFLMHVIDTIFLMFLFFIKPVY